MFARSLPQEKGALRVPHEYSIKKWVSLYKLLETNALSDEEKSFITFLDGAK
jgi:hypothetical protein